MLHLLNPKIVTSLAVSSSLCPFGKRGLPRFPPLGQFVIKQAVAKQSVVSRMSAENFVILLEPEFCGQLENKYLT